MKLPVSVIIPTCNRAEMLQRAIESVQRQTQLPVELIVVDDGSEDETAGVVEAIARQSSLAITCLHQANRGPAAARNRGIKAATGSFLAFLDSDDHWRPTKLEKQYGALAARPEVLISHTRERWYRRGQHLNQKKKHLVAGASIFTPCLQLCCVGMSTVMVRREIFERYGLFNETMPCCEDYDLWLRVAAFEEFLLIDEQLTIKEGGRPDQLSAIYRTGMDRFRIGAIIRLLECSPLSLSQRQAACGELIRKCLIYGAGCRKHGRFMESEFYVRFAVTARQRYLA